MPSFSTAKRISLTASLTFWVTPSSCGCAFFRYSTITPSLGLSLPTLHKCLAHLCGRIHSLAMRWLLSVKPPIPLRHHDARFLGVRFLNPPKRRRSLRWNLVLSVAERFGPYLQAKFADAASRLRRGGAGGANRGGIPRPGRPTDEDTRICRVGSGSVSQHVQAGGREIVSLPRSVRPSRFVHLLPNRVLHFGRKGAQDGRGRRRRLGDIAPVGILVGERPAKGNLLYLGFGEAGPNHQLSDAPRIGHGEGAWGLRLGRRNMSL